MTDHAVLIPTSEGPVGGIVSEPDGECRAGLILLPGLGRAARSGINAFWTRTARTIAEAGVAVLRFDYSREGETLPVGEGGRGQIWKRDLDLYLLEQVTPWFRERVGSLSLLFAGSCSGARLAIEFAGREPEAVGKTFLVVPYLRALAQPGEEGGAEPSGTESVDPMVVDYFRGLLSRGPSWILVGEQDTSDIPKLRRLLGPTTHELEVEVVPEMALHLVDQPPLQEEVAERLVARVKATGLVKSADPRTRESAWM